MKTLKYILCILALLVIAGSVGYYPLVYGYYVPYVDIVYAINEYVCLHEIAHKADYLSGWQSRTDEWETAAQGYDLSQGYTELYANLYSDYMGHAEMMPQELLKFYDFGLLHNLKIEHCSNY